MRIRKDSLQEAINSRSEKIFDFKACLTRSNHPIHLTQTPLRIKEEDMWAWNCGQFGFENNIYIKLNWRYLARLFNEITVVLQSITLSWVPIQEQCQPIAWICLQFWCNKNQRLSPFFLQIELEIWSLQFQHGRFYIRSLALTVSHATVDL